MTVKELIQKLSRENPEATVYYEHHRGDYVRHVDACEVKHVATETARDDKYYGKTIVSEERRHRYDAKGDEVDPLTEILVLS